MVIEKTYNKDKNLRSADSCLQSGKAEIQSQVCLNSSKRESSLSSYQHAKHGLQTYCSARELLGNKELTGALGATRKKHLICILKVKVSAC